MIWLCWVNEWTEFGLPVSTAERQFNYAKNKQQQPTAANRKTLVLRRKEQHDIEVKVNSSRDFGFVIDHYFATLVFQPIELTWKETGNKDLKKHSKAIVDCPTVEKTWAAE